jgi:adenylate cyclase
MRRRLDDPATALEFSVLEDIRDQGNTDYFARMVHFEVAEIRDHMTGMATSWSTDYEDGFSDQHIEILERLLPRLALSLDVGPASGQRILAGDIRPGMMEVLPAVIFYADLRGFTTVSDTMPYERIGDMLNEYFECMVRPVMDRGGHVLKFLGDGLLAAFDTSTDEADPLCSLALSAATDAIDRVTALNEERRAIDWLAMELDIALHLGDVLYGNVGTADRLDFTVIGPAVNEASHIETLCQPPGYNVLVSEAFAGAAATCAQRLQPVGRHAYAASATPRNCSRSAFMYRVRSRF